MPKGMCKPSGQNSFRMLTGLSLRVMSIDTVDNILLYRQLRTNVEYNVQKKHIPSFSDGEHKLSFYLILHIMLKIKILKYR